MEQSNDALNEGEVQGAPSEEGKRERSTIVFPYNDLNDAISVARAVWENVGTSTCDLSQLAAWTDHESTTSGAFRLKVSAARIFGLVSTGSKQVALTELGRQIVDNDHAVQARVDAFLRVPLYARLFENYKSTQLPTTNVALEAEIADLGVGDKQKDKARQVFLRSAEQAGFFPQGRGRLVRPAIREGDTPDPKSKDGGSGGNGGSGGGTGENHPFIAGLVQTLPKPGAIWPKAARAKWTKAAEAAFDLIYIDDEEDKGSVTPADSTEHQQPS